MSEENKPLTPSVFFHPGEYLKEALEEQDMSIEAFSDNAQIPESTVRGVLNGEISVTPEMALIFECTVGMKAYMWLGIQHDYDNYVLSKKDSSLLNKLAFFARRNVAAL